MVFDLYTVFHELILNVKHVCYSHLALKFNKLEVYKIMNRCENSDKNISDSRTTAQKATLHYFKNDCCKYL